jgi:nucleotide-binding universal stress UspA family protein
MKGPLSKVLVVINGSESSIVAAKHAISLGKIYGTEVVAVYVVDTATIRQLALSRIFVPEEGREYEESLEESGRRLIAYVAELGAGNKVPVRTALRKGAVAGEVIAFAEEIEAECILLGQSAHPSQFRDVLMDVYMEIARNATCSVLIVKGEQAERFFRAL